MSHISGSGPGDQASDDDMDRADTLLDNLRDASFFNDIRDLHDEANREENFAYVKKDYVTNPPKNEKDVKKKEKWTYKKQVDLQREDAISLTDATAISVLKGSEYIKRMEEKYRESYIRTYPFLRSNFHQCIAFKDKTQENTVYSERYLSVQFVSIPKSEISKFNQIKVG